MRNRANNSKPNIGIHLSISKGFAAAVREAADLGCTCVQIFVGSPRTWRKRAISDTEAADCRAAAIQDSVSIAAWRQRTNTT